MDKFGALIEIIWEARKERRSVAGYKRLLRALRVLEFHREDQKVILAHLDYVEPGTGAPYKWLSDKLIAKQQSK